MKKLALVTILVVLTAGTVYADNLPTEEDYKNMDELRTKLVRMKKEMDRFMKDIITTYPADGTSAVMNFGQDVKIDVVETTKDIIVTADLPGMEKDKIDAVLEGSKTLKISGMREVVKSEEAPGVVKKERMQGKFERTLELPAECLSEGIKASYKNGVLELVIPKKEQVKEESVKINIQ